MEFKSAICTSVEESKRLLALGLKKETADMSYIPIVVNYKVEYRLDCSTPKNIDIPAWSLHRLLEMLYADIGECMIFFPNTYDECIADIENYIRRGIFNQDYLEDKQ